MRNQLLARMRDPDDDEFGAVTYQRVSGDAVSCADCGTLTDEVFCIPDAGAGEALVCPRCAPLCRAIESWGGRSRRVCGNVATGRCSECGLITCTFHRRGCEFDHKRTRGAPGR